MSRGKPRADSEKQKAENKKGCDHPSALLSDFPNSWAELERLPDSTSSAFPDANWIAGVDEVGRGALFGPVVAAAVILPREEWIPLAAAGVQDSKTLTHRRRCQLAKQIRAVAVDCKIGMAAAREIDRLNILQATLLAMKRAIFKLQLVPDLCLIDGNQPIPDLGVPQQTMIKGDSTSLVIAAASIVAKVWRDELIVRLAEKYPEYDLIKNKGYGTAQHRKAIEQYGITKQHRLSFSPCQPTLFDVNELG